MSKTVGIVQLTYWRFADLIPHALCTKSHSLKEFKKKNRLTTSPEDQYGNPFNEKGLPSKREKNQREKMYVPEMLDLILVLDIGLTS